ncbi:DUF1802 family protein [Paenibacillus chartarius]|uniref:DUF1802 family protein n=1 Tax=Paenibacillus chartarius TaxID=747481 RepID=A0ABV6DFC6_9BACL
MTERIALKEWASTVAALREGKQIVLLRKGGIAEETRDFRLRSHSFYLFPAYEHQKKELLKEEYRPLVDETLAVWSPEDETVTIDCRAEVAEDIELTELSDVEKLLPYHIWTERFAEERLHWKRLKPLHLLIVRVYKLDTPLELRLDPGYFGCKSWVELLEEPAGRSGTAVLPDSEFQSKVDDIHRALRR